MPPDSLIDKPLGIPRFHPTEICSKQFAEKLEIALAMRHIRIQSLRVANLSCVAQTGLESMLPIGTPQKPFSANC
jgi:hypothetical protein